MFSAVKLSSHSNATAASLPATELLLCTLPFSRVVHDRLHHHQGGGSDTSTGSYSRELTRDEHLRWT